MVINSQTKIAALLKHHPDALEAIVALSPDFKKLRNPILRKLMAGRTSIAMASKIGGCTPEDFFKKLKPLGFEAGVETKEEDDALDPSILPSFIKDLHPAHIVSLDVREMLAKGSDPLKLIQRHVKELKDGQVLKIINTFEPTPLIKLLENQGFQSHVDVLEKDLIETYLYKIAVGGEVQLEAKADIKDDWSETLTRFGKTEQLDVRHLEMPMPMMSILEALTKLPPDTLLFVRHKRIPVFLLTELKERNFDYRIKEINDGEVHMLIFKD